MTNVDIAVVVKLYFLLPTIVQMAVDMISRSIHSMIYCRANIDIMWYMYMQWCMYMQRYMYM